MRKKKSIGITSKVTSDIKPSQKSRKTRDSLTRVTSPIKGTLTQAKQWNRWTP